MITNCIHLDFNKENDLKVPSVQYDSGSRFVKIKLQRNKSPFKIDGYRVTVVANKVDGTEIMNDCTILDGVNGVVQFEITEQFNAVEGVVDCQLKLFKGKTLLTSMPFSINVVKSVSTKEIVSSNELKTLVNALGEVQNIDNRFAQTNAQLSTKIDKSELNKVQTQIDNLVINASGDSNAEVVQARGGYSTLNGRIDAIEDGKLTKVTFKNLVQNPNFNSGDSTWDSVNNSSFSIENNTCTFLPNKKYGQIKTSLPERFLTGQKLIVIAEIQAENPTGVTYEVHNNDGNCVFRKSIGNTVAKQTLYGLCTIDSLFNGVQLYARVLDSKESDFKPIKVTGFSVIPLTAQYGFLNGFSDIDKIYQILTTETTPFFKDVVYSKLLMADITYSLDDGIISPNHLSFEGVEANRGKTYPLKAYVRDGSISEPNGDMNKVLLDVKVFNANPDKFYRLAWLGFGVTLGSSTKEYGVIIEEYDKSTYSSSSSTSKRVLVNYSESNMQSTSSGVITRVINSNVCDTYFVVTYDNSVISDGGFIGMNNENQYGYSYIIDPVNYFYAGVVLGDYIKDKTITYDKFNDDVVELLDSRYKKNKHLTNIAPDGNFEDISKWNHAGLVTYELKNNEMIMRPTGQHANVRTKITEIPKEDSIYYIGCYVSSKDYNTKLTFFDFSTSNNYGAGADYSGSNFEYQLLCTTAKIPKGCASFGARVVQYGTDFSYPIKFKKMVILNLTDIFGYGNEPSAKVMTDLILNNVGEEFYFESLDESVIESIENDDQASYPLKVEAVNDDYVKIISPYSNTHDLAVLIQRTGANNICNFKQIALINKSNQAITKLAEMGTDWLGPWIISVKQNINGDQPNCGHFTGGNHAYDNSGTAELSDTGRTEWIKIFVDGQQVQGSYNGGCFDVKIQFKNLIQAYNTIKEDGSGREVLEEVYTIRCNELGKFNVENIIRALEPLKIHNYMGLQCTNYGWSEKMLYLSDNNRKWLPVANQKHDSGGNTCDKVILVDGQHQLTMGIDRTTGLAMDKAITPACYTESYGKTYFSLVTWQRYVELDTDEIISYNGFYKFESI